MKIRLHSTICMSWAVFCVLLSSPLCSEAENSKSEPVENQQIINNVGNTLCPVSGKPVDGTNCYVYNNNIHHLCSSKCAAPFAEDPEKYSEKAKQSAKESSTTNK